MNTQTLYQEAIKFATEKHVQQGQKIPGTDLPYVVHLSNVAMEILIASFNSDNFDLEFALPLALLHDTLEDTSTSFEELKAKFGIEIAEAVSALSKNKDIPKEQRMTDSLNRIKKLKKEVWAVKLADRITNMQKPPDFWDNQKRVKYKSEAEIIMNELGKGNDYLAERLKAKIEEYSSFI